MPSPTPGSTVQGWRPMSSQVVAFCDVDENKIKKGFYCYEDAQVCGGDP